MGLYTADRREKRCSATADIVFGTCRSWKSWTGVEIERWGLGLVGRKGDGNVIGWGMRKFVIAVATITAMRRELEEVEWNGLRDGMGWDACNAGSRFLFVGTDGTDNKQLLSVPRYADTMQTLCRYYAG